MDSSVEILMINEFLFVNISIEMGGSENEVPGVRKICSVTYPR
jgi:hypothetical protein